MEMQTQCLNFDQDPSTCLKGVQACIGEFDTMVNASKKAHSKGFLKTPDF